RFTGTDRVGEAWSAPIDVEVVQARSSTEVVAPETAQAGEPLEVWAQVHTAEAEPTAPGSPDGEEATGGAREHTGLLNLAGASGLFAGDDEGASGQIATL